MTAFSIAENQLVSNMKFVSIPMQVLANAFNRTITMQLVSAQWKLKEGSGKIDFGVEVSFDFGETWEIVAAVTGVTIGWMGKGEVMPTFSCSSPQLVGKMARVFLRSTADIKVGISGEIV